MHESAFLMHIAVLLVTAVLAAWMFRIVRAPSIIGYLFTGILIGPSGLELIPEEEVGSLAEMGLVPLLFTIGLELSHKPLIRMGKSLLLAAFLQIVVTALLAGGLAWRLMELSAATAGVIGIVVALSSAAIVLKQLSDRGETSTVSRMITTGGPRIRAVRNERIHASAAGDTMAKAIGQKAEQRMGGMRGGPLR